MYNYKAYSKILEELSKEKTKMKYYLPTYEDALEMVKSKGELVFYETKSVIEGYQISVFNYRLAQYADFINPVQGREDILDAKEMRGLTFVFNEDGSVYKRYIMLQKFWNVNQVAETQYNVLKDMKIKAVYNKEDGSLLTFIKLPNGNIIPKTKVGLDNDQTVAAQKVYNEDENIQNFVKYCLDNDLVAMWEYVSWQNKIVLNYNEPELILLKVRNNNTGEYIDIEDFREKGIKVVEGETANNLEELMKKAETEKDKEGWVIQFENGYLVKQKTLWYFDAHKLVSDLEYENVIIKMIIEEEIDDVIAQLETDRDSERIEWINNIEEIVKDYINERVADVNELLSKYDNDIRDFAIRYQKDINFGMAMSVIRGKVDVYDVVKDWLKYQTRNLMQARSFIKRKGFKRK